MVEVPVQNLAPGIYQLFLQMPNHFPSGLLSIKHIIIFYTKSEYFYSLNYPNANNCRAFIANNQFSR